MPILPASRCSRQSYAQAECAYELSVDELALRRVLMRIELKLNHQGRFTAGRDIDFEGIHVQGQQAIVAHHRRELSQ